MNARETPGHVEYSDDALLQALDDAAERVRAAEELARYDTTRAEVIERFTEKSTDRGDHIFMRAFRNDDGQALSQVISGLKDAYVEVVAEKKAAILAESDGLN
ncbi:hypothetical protein [Caballeronia sp. KNU42]